VKKDTSVFNIETSSNNYVVDNLIVHNSNSPAQPPIKTLSQARLSYAEEIIKRPITNPSQSQALLEAHNAESLWQKTHILREAGFTIEEAGALIRTHVVGRAKVSFTTRININRRLQFFVDSEAEESINAIKSMQQHHNPNHPTPLRPKLLDMTPEKLALRIEAGLEGKDFKPVGTDIASHITKGYQIHSASVVIEGQTILVRVRIENPNCMLGKILSIEHVHPITR